MSLTYLVEGHLFLFLVDLVIHKWLRHPHQLSFPFFIFSFVGFIIVIACKLNNYGFGSVGVKLLNNDGGGRKLLNVVGSRGEKLLNVDGGCGGGDGIKLLNVGGGGGGGAG